MKVTIAAPGKFQPAYHLARHLAEREELRTLFTPIPAARTAAFGLARESQTVVSAIGYTQWAGVNWGPDALKPYLQAGLGVAYDRFVAARLGDEDVFNGWNSVALASLRRAKKLGCTTVLTTGSTHIGWQTDEMRAEVARWGVPTPATHPWFVRRSEEEYDHADVIVTPSGFSARTFAERGIPAERVVVIPWAVQAVSSSPDRSHRTGPPTILFVGQCGLRKGIPYLFEAFRKLAAPARLRLVGPTYKGVFDAAGGVPEGVEVTGPLRGAELAAAYEQADLFVLPSIEEGSAFVVWEALAAGLPVVVTDRVGADQVVDGVSGFVVGARDVDALADRLTRLAGDPALRLEMGSSASAAFRTRSWDDYGRDSRGLFERLLRGEAA